MIAEEILAAESLYTLERYFEIDDPQLLRLAVNRIGQLQHPESEQYLLELWEGSLSERMRTAPSIRHPIVRVTIAQELYSYVGHAEHGNYIKSMAKHHDWIVQAVTAEALETVGDYESISILIGLARSQNRSVSRAAVASLLGIARTRDNSDEAFLALNELLQDISEFDPIVLEDIRAAIEETRSRSINPNNELSFRDAPEINITELTERAVQGDLVAQHILGEIYLVGIKSEADYVQALRWLRLAAEDGDYAPAKFTLAQMYLTGRGVEKNQSIAIELLNEASSQNYEPAILLLERIDEH